MRLLGLKFKAISTAFPGAVELPLAELEPGIIAVVGANGQGKTVILEAAPAAIYRKLPARKGGLNVAAFAVARDAYLELLYQFETADGPQRYRARLNLDGQTRATDALLERLDAAGPVPLNNGQASTYDVAIRAQFPSLDLFLNSSFAAQGRGDEFARATPSKRKDLFAEFLALRRLLEMGQIAGAAAAKYQSLRDRLAARLAQLLAAPDDAKWILEESAALEARAAACAPTRARLRDEIAALEQRERLMGDATAAYAAAEGRLDDAFRAYTERDLELGSAQQARALFVDQTAPRELTALRTDAKVAWRDVDERLLGNQTIQDRAAAIMAAVEAQKVIDAAVAARRLELEAKQTARSAVADSLARLEADVSAFVAPQQALVRARLDAGLLRNVPCGGVAPYDRCQFLLNASEAAGRIAALEAQVAEIATAIANRDRVRVAVADLDRALGIDRDWLAALARDRAGHDANAKYATALAESSARVAELRARRAELEAGLVRALEAATTRHAARVAEFDRQVAELVQAVGRLADALDSARTARDKAAAGNTQAAELRAALAELRAAWDRLVAEEAAVEAGQAEIGRRRAVREARLLVERRLGERLTAVDAELAEWLTLAKALGKGGLPDLEIDAAGPSISALTNDLLLATYGPRFSLELVTQVEKAGGAGMRDEFTVRVLDNDDAGGGWRDIGELSGGERVIVQEALMLAICLYVNERSPLPIRTLWRDENDAALDANNAGHYLEMLRRARAIGKFDHIFFVSHRADVQARADAQIRVGGGGAAIVRPPYEVTT